MTGRRLCAVIMTVAAAAAMSACSEVAAGQGGGSSTADSQALQLGPLPTRASTVAPLVSTTIVPLPPRRTTTTSSVPGTTTSTSTSSTSTTVQAHLPMTSCTRLAYIGDSVSLGMVADDASPNASTRLNAQLAAIGVADLRVEISGGRSIVETLDGQENAVQVATRLRGEGFSGCWVIAIGTNDAANIAAGAGRQAVERIRGLMGVIGSDPVLWLDAATITDEGFWAAANMETWNAVLTAMAPSYPNLRIVPWSGFVQPQWYQPDGIHLVDAGSAARVQVVVASLLEALPQR